MAQMVRAGIRGMGLAMLPDDAHAVDTVTVVRTPEGLDANEVVVRARERYGVVLGRGIRRLEHTVVRIGHLGYTRPEALVVSFVTLALVISVTFGYFSAGSTQITCASLFA